LHLTIEIKFKMIRNKGKKNVVAPAHPSEIGNQT